MFDRKLASCEQGLVSLSQEVVMRSPEVFMRELSLEEGARLELDIPSLSLSGSGR
jgi:hypothetical protein